MSTPLSPFLNEVLDLARLDSEDIVDDAGNTWLHQAVLLYESETSIDKKTTMSRIQALVAFGFDINQENHAKKTPLDLATKELKTLLNKWSKEKETQQNRDALNKKIANHKWKNEMRHQWNGLIAFAAGLTIIYPIVRTMQYLWKLKLKPAAQRWWRNRGKNSQQSDTTTQATLATENAGEQTLAVNYKTWSMYYEYGLSGTWGTSHTQKELKKGIPEKYNQVLCVYKT